MSSVGPGIYYGLSFEGYKALEGLNAHRIYKLAISPGHCVNFGNTPNLPTEAFKVGAWVEDFVTNRKDIESIYVVGPTEDKRTKKWKDFEAGLEEGQTALKPSEAKMLYAMRHNAMSHPKAGPLLEQSTRDNTQVAVVAKDPDHGFLRKGLMDLLVGRTLVDIKSTRDLEWFRSDIYRYKYHWQLAWYIDLLRFVDYLVTDAVIIAIEKKAPYACGVYRPTMLMLDKAREQMAPLLLEYKKCLETDTWPLGPQEVVSVGEEEIELEDDEEAE